MNTNEKKDFLNHCIETAMILERKTDEQISVLVGWISDKDAMNLPVAICLNYDEWFEGWSQQVVLDNADKFTPVKNPYLALNKLVDLVYTERSL